MTVITHDMTFAEAVAAMDAGYVVKREHGDGWCWRKAPQGLWYQCADQAEGDNWGAGSFDYGDIHATDWRIVEEGASSMTGVEAVRALNDGAIVERVAENGDVVQYRQIGQHYEMRLFIRGEEGSALWTETGLFYDDLHATHWRVVANQKADEAQDGCPTRDGMIEWMHQEGLDIREMEDPSGDRWHVMWGKEFVQKLAAQFPAMFRPEESS